MCFMSSFALRRGSMKQVMLKETRGNEPILSNKTSFSKKRINTSTFNVHMPRFGNLS